MGLLLEPENEASWKNFPSRSDATSDMILRLWRCLCVSRELAKSYAARSVTREGLKHAWVVGTADPTNVLPEGHVLVPGMGKEQGKHPELFVTSSPCLVPSDGRMLPVVTEKPANMADEDWEFLNQEYFGTIIFVNPAAGRRPLPKMVAGGDLDGDLYFICWDNDLLASISDCFVEFDYSSTVDDASDVSNEPFVDLADLRDPVPDPTISSHDTETGNWFDKVQDLMTDSASLVQQSAFIGYLYNEAGKVADNSDDFMRNQDAISFGAACKEAIDLGKHGGKVHLPRHLAELVPRRFHNFLN